MAKTNIKHYIFLVHGTWGKSEKGWYRNSDDSKSFINQLEVQFKDTQLEGALLQEDSVFEWKAGAFNKPVEDLTDMDDEARILSIEDEDTLRRTIVAYLEDSGFDMIQAQNGAVGLEVFNRERPDLVWFDLRMPEGDGLRRPSRLTTCSRS